MRTILLMVVIALLALMVTPMPERADVESSDAPLALYGICPSFEIIGGDAERREAVILNGGHPEEMLNYEPLVKNNEIVAHNGQAVVGPGVSPHPA